ncbi:MAG: hypothetical protein KC933_10970 [Myxococcales bacterium]|nr:hypothetical protein [Myxococcales bacterium]
MIRFRVTARCPVPLPHLPAVTITLVADPGLQGLLLVEGDDPRFVTAVRERLRGSYGVRGRLLGGWVTPEDLLCAMQGEAMMDLRPKRVV